MLKANLERCVLSWFLKMLASETLRRCGGRLFHRAGPEKEHPLSEFGTNGGSATLTLNGPSSTIAMTLTLGLLK